MSNSIWFWQRIVSPHMACLASVLADRGRDVTYVAEQPMSASRRAQGWQVPDVGRARLIYAPDRLATQKAVESAPNGSVHICQGLRGNGLVATAQAGLSRRNLRQWVVLETVEDDGWLGILRRLEYRRLITKHKKDVWGYLGIGYRNPDWLVRRGASSNQVFPFAYFLAEAIPARSNTQSPSCAYRILFIGRLIGLKRLDLLIQAVAALGNDNVELHVIGSGPLETQLRQIGEDQLGTKIHWIGGVPADEVPHHLMAADLLVLPSRYDGWGAVVSEAMMAGTPVVCSDACGSAGVVVASGQGGVFKSGSLAELIDLLQRMIAAGRLSRDQRQTLAEWSRRLGAGAGASYLQEIIAFSQGCSERPTPPWEL